MPWDSEGKIFIQNKYPIGKLLVRNPSGFVGCPITGKKSFCVIYRNLTANELDMLKMLYPYLSDLITNKRIIAEEKEC